MGFFFFFNLCKHKKLFNDISFQEWQKGLMGRHFIPFGLYLFLQLFYLKKETKVKFVGFSGLLLFDFFFHFGSRMIIELWFIHWSSSSLGHLWSLVFAYVPCWVSFLEATSFFELNQILSSRQGMYFMTHPPPARQSVLSNVTLFFFSISSQDEEHQGPELSQRHSVFCFVVECVPLPLFSFSLHNLSKVAM